MPVEVLGWSTLALRIAAALLVGGIIGWDRRRAGKPAGMRTHMLVSLGSCVLVLVPLGLGASSDAVSHVVQGIATGIGFLGAGEILHRVTDGAAKAKVKGLTSAAAAWLTAALGIAAGCGLWKTLTLAAGAALMILTLVKRLEDALFQQKPREGQPS